MADLSPTTGLISHEIRHLREKRIEKTPRRRGNSRFLHRHRHQLKPPVTLGYPNPEWNMPHLQSRMPTHLHVTDRSPQPKQQKLRQSILRTLPVPFRIHRPYQIVRPDTPVKRGNHSPDAVLTTSLHHLAFRHANAQFTVFHPMRKPVFHQTRRLTAKIITRPTRPIIGLEIQACPILSSGRLNLQKLSRSPA